MRGCLTFIVGLLLGAGVVLYWWPKQPATEAVPGNADIRIQLSDSYLSRLVGAQVAGMGVSDVTVSSAPPSTLIAAGTLNLAVVTAPVSIQIQPVASGGKIHVNVVDLRIGAVPLPGGMTSLVADSINRSINSHLGSKATVQAVRVTPSGLLVAADSR